jgi:Fe-Mn family superoxide dismutase
MSSQQKARRQAMSKALSQDFGAAVIDRLLSQMPPIPASDLAEFSGSMMDNAAPDVILLDWARAAVSVRRLGTSIPVRSPRRAVMNQFTRREALQTAAAGAAALVLSPLPVRAEDKKEVGFKLPKLPYAYDALEPNIDAETMHIHHEKHHAAYVANLNKALSGHPDLLAKEHVSEILRHITSVPEKIRQAVINNGGGHANHTMFWRIMGPKGGGQPSGELAKAIDSFFGSFDKFQAKLTAAATTQFGSGWGWLVLDKGKLEVYGDKNQDSPFLKGHTPILGIDVWEHAYYLKYRNVRADYIKAWWKVVNWDVVAERYKNAMKG